MKTFDRVLSLIIIVSFLTGCTATTDFDLKKECSAYIDKYQAEYTGEPSDPETQSIIYGKDIFHNIFDGVYYSKRLSSCIVVVDIMIIRDYDGEIVHIPFYVDALTGVPVDTVELRKSNSEIKDADNFYDFLQLVK